MQVEQFDNYFSNPNNIIETELLNEHILCGLAKDIAPKYRTSKEENCMILTYTLTGVNHLVTSEKTYEITENTFCFRHPKLEYKLLFGNTKENRRCFLKLPIEFFRLLEVTFPNISKLPIVFKPNEDYDVLGEFFSLMGFISNTDKTRPYESFTYIFDFIFAVLKLSPIYSKSSAVQSIYKLLDKDFHTPLEDLVENFDINYNTFRKEFAEIYGTSPAKYRNLCKIEHAKSLLITGMSCGEVAQKLQYADIYTFSHQFKNIVGTSPKTFIEHSKKEP